VRHRSHGFFAVWSLGTALLGCSTSQSAPVDGGSTDAGVTICGTVDPGSGTFSVDGGVTGQAPSDVVAFSGTVPRVEGFPAPVAYAGISISNLPGTCRLLQGAQSLGHPDVSNATSVVVVIQQSGGDAIVPGTYSITTATGVPSVNALYRVNDTQCHTDATFVTGTITLTQVACGALAGSFDIALPPPDAGNPVKLTGTFSSPTCDFDLFGALVDAGQLGNLLDAASTACAP